MKKHRCSRCKRTKFLVKNFHKDKNRKSGFYPVCKLCVSMYQTNYQAKYKKIVFDHYGNKCVCKHGKSICGENTPEFLSIDHINGNGKKHRNRNKVSGSNFYRFITLKLKFPKNLQILCHNCNLAKGFYGGCPHNKTKREEQCK